MGISPLQLVREIDEDESAVATTKAAADIRLERPPIQLTRIDPVVFRHALEAVLANDDLPPPSIRMVADRLGQTPANLHYYFPELCRAIAFRYRSHEEARGVRTRTRLRETVRDAAIDLTHRGLYPSASHIADLLGDRNVMRSHTAQAAWREVWANSAGSVIGLPERQTTYSPSLQHHAREPRSSKPSPLQPINRGSGSPTAALACEPKPKLGQNGQFIN